MLLRLEPVPALSGPCGAFYNIVGKFFFGHIARGNVPCAGIGIAARIDTIHDGSPPDIEAFRLGNAEPGCIVFYGQRRGDPVDQPHAGKPRSISVVFGALIAGPEGTQVRRCAGVGAHDPEIGLAALRFEAEHMVGVNTQRFDLVSRCEAPGRQPLYVRVVGTVISLLFLRAEEVAGPRFSEAGIPPETSVRDSAPM